MTTGNLIMAIVGTKGAGAGLKSAGGAARTVAPRLGAGLQHAGTALARMPTVDDLAIRAAHRLPGLRLSPVPAVDLGGAHHIDTPRPTTTPATNPAPTGSIAEALGRPSGIRTASEVPGGPQSAPTPARSLTDPPSAAIRTPADGPSTPPDLPPERYGGEARSEPDSQGSDPVDRDEPGPDGNGVSIDETTAATAGPHDRATARPDQTADAANDPAVQELAANRFATPAGEAFYESSDSIMRRAAQGVPEKPGSFTVDMHGDSAAVYVGNKSFSPGQLAQFLESQKSSWAGEPVRLFSCETGQGSAPFAQQLADRLGVDVEAPDQLAWSDDAGNVYSTSAELDQFGYVTDRPTLPEDGQWIAFRPKGAT